MRASAAVPLLLLAAACSAPSATSHATSAPGAAHDDQPLLVSTRCADLVVLGARGSGQSATKNRGVGAEVLASVEDLARRLHQRSTTTVRLEDVPYDAAGADYQDAVVAGAQMVQRRLTELADACPRTHLALVGFSQGAQVVHGASIDVPASLARRIALVAMIADPRRDPDDAIAQWAYGTRPTRPGRLGAGTPIDSDLRPAAISLCVAADEICNAHGTPGAPPSATHRHFYEKASSARSTGHRLDLVVRGRGL